MKLLQQLIKPEKYIKYAKAALAKQTGWFNKFDTSKGITLDLTPKNYDGPTCKFGVYDHETGSEHPPIIIYVITPGEWGPTRAWHDGRPVSIPYLFKGEEINQIKHPLLVQILKSCGLKQSFKYGHDDFEGYPRYTFGGDASSYTHPNIIKIPIEMNYTKEEQEIFKNRKVEIEAAAKEKADAIEEQKKQDLEKKLAPTTKDNNEKIAEQKNEKTPEKPSGGKEPKKDVIKTDGKTDAAEKQEATDKYTTKQTSEVTDKYATKENILKELNTENLIKNFSDGYDKFHNELDSETGPDWSGNEGNTGHH